MFSLFSVFSCYCFSLILMSLVLLHYLFFFFKQKTAYEMRISDWSSDVCSSDLASTCLPRPPCPRCSGSEPPVPDRRTNSERVRPAGSASPQIGRASCRERVCQYV